MNNKEIKKITIHNLLRFLKKENLATIATVNDNNKPDAATIHYVVRDNLDIFFLTKKETGKYKNIQRQNEVVLIVTNAEDLETVKIRGNAFTVKGDSAIVSEIVTTLAHSEKFIADLDKLLPIIKRNAGEMVVVKIKPYEIRMSRYHMESLQEELFYLDNNNIKA